MPRKSDMNNIRKRSVFRGGKLQTAYQVRVRLQDDRGIARHHTQTFDTHEAAVQWRDAKRAQVQQGALGESMGRRKLLQSISLEKLIRRYLEDPNFTSKRSSANEEIALNAFLRSEASRPSSGRLG